METFKFKHPRRVYLYALLSFLMCMLGASSVSGRTARNPIVKLIYGPNYSDNGTEVTLKLWMYNYDGDNAYFTGNVMLRIDDKDVCTLNNMWSLISNVYHKDEDRIKNYENRGNVGSQGIIKLDGVNVGTAQFCNAKKNQKCPDNSNKSETKWTTIELKLSFNNSFSYRKHTVSVKGNWRDRCDDKKYGDKTWDLQNTLHGFIYPTNLDISKIGYDVKFTWEYSGSETNETRTGKWVLYRIENGKCVKQVEDTNPFTKHFTIADKDFRCLATYYLTFQPNALNETTIIAGLTKGYTKGSHTPFEGVCTVCQHGIFSYTTANGKTIPLANNIDFGSKILSHTIDSKGTCIIEFEGKFTRIPDGAFKDTKINSYNIKIPNTVTSIGSYAFANTLICGSLIIPNSVTEIKEGAFENCKKLSSLTLPSNLKRIESLVFKSCGFSGSLTIPNSVTEIGHHAFYDCNNFTKELILSENLKTIGSYAFAGCSGFSEGNLTIPNSVTVIGIGAFSDCSSFRKELKLSENLTKIGKDVFKNCKLLSGNLTIPNSVTEIGDGAFNNCFSFYGLTLSNKLTKIGNQAFMNCNSLRGNLTIPNSVTEIGDEAFSYCRGFNGNLTLPNNLKTIRKKAFNGCNSLNGTLTIPNSVTEIGEGAFLNCSGFNADLILPEKLKTIGANAFNGCYRLQKEQVVLPTTLESIGSSAFDETGIMLNSITYQSLPQGIGNNFFSSGKRIYIYVSLSDESYIKDLTSNIIVSGGASYSRTMSNTWGTIILPYSLTLTGNEPYSLYAIDRITADELVLRRISERVEAGTAYVVRRDGEQQTLNFTESNQSRLIKAMKPTKVADGLNFQGTYHAKEVTDGYIIRNGLLWDVAKLKAASPQTEAIMVGPFRSWLDGTTNGAAKRSIRVDDSATGIDNPISSLNADDVEYYDLNGRRLTAPQQGINIMKRGNKTMKVIIK
ncbi:leucine-rich repeat domain-containing protein [Prevotella sp.]|uniref:leucine-rich repeat domain-containing protein n=1 Tax=Prevotella sp. TaxID=59823 RepID=UPI003077DCBA